MTKLPDYPAVYVEFSDSENPHVNFIILDEQGKEITHLSLDSALSITEATLAYMEWEERRLKKNMH
jgi:hypothetical protein